jgi:hypothetical protein
MFLRLQFFDYGKAARNLTALDDNANVVDCRPPALAVSFIWPGILVWIDGIFRTRIADRLFHVIPHETFRETVANACIKLGKDR